MKNTCILLGVFIVALLSVQSANAGRWERKSAEHKRDCEQWCAQNEQCHHCSTNRACGIGYERTISWTGYGKNWHACRAKDWYTRNKDKCESWCAGQKHCDHCSTINFCGPHFDRMKKWSGYGQNWSACKKDGKVNLIWDDYKGKDIYPTTRVLVVTLGGSGASKDSVEDGFEWFCEDYIFGTNLARRVKCISSYGSIVTNSEKLSENIINLIHTITVHTNRSPKVILVGKSMGGCKLQHALYKRILKNYPINTFFGVDTSCYVSKHWQEGEGLLFHRNVETLQNFYQTIDSSQTGHVLAYSDQYVGKIDSEGEAGRRGEFHYTFDRHNSHNQINVNTMDFNFQSMRKTGGNMCNHVHHTHATRPIDRCQNLRDGIFSYIQRKAYE